VALYSHRLPLHPTISLGPFPILPYHRPVYVQTNPIFFFSNVSAGTTAGRNAFRH